MDRETEEILDDENLMRQIRESEEDIKNGDVYPVKDTRWWSEFEDE